MARLERVACLAISVALALVVGACEGPLTPSPSVAGTAPAASDGAVGPASPTGSAAVGSAAPGSADLLATSYKAAAGKNGGTVVIGDWQEANQFHPYFVSEPADARVAAAAWRSLVVLAPDGGYSPDLATAIPTTANGGVSLPGEDGDAMTVHWELRDGLLWSDGEPLTCGDFRYAWEWVNDPDNVGVIPAGFEDIRAFDCPSATAMVWHFDRIYAGYVTLMTAPLPRHYLAGIAMEDQMTGVGFRASEIAKVPVSGPFRFDAVTPGTEIRMTRNPNDRNRSTGKPPHLDGLVWKWFADADTVVAEYRAGRIDVAPSIPDTLLPKVADLGRQVSTTGSQTYEVLRPNWSATTCSTDAELGNRGSGCPLADAELRRAIAQAVDRTAIIKDVLHGIVDPAVTSVAPAAWFERDLPPAPSGPDRARTTLDAAGWLIARDGARAKSGLTARIELCTTTDSVRQATAAAIATSLKAVGIQTVVHAVEPEVLFADAESAPPGAGCVLTRGDFDLALHDLPSVVEPLDAFFADHASQISPNGANQAAVSDPTLDAALGTVRNSADLTVIRDAMAEFQRVYVDRTVEIPLYTRRSVGLVAAKLGNRVASPFRAGLTWNVGDWFVK
ncbi:MAG TPA: peptide ABC transporter substrate-binding protein [Patescibacteria group bacterium]|nr:peptide ABC transporter substrate-binding protein [Patescibacteria group bacterium]